MDKYRITVWDKKANNPYYVIEHNDEKTAKSVARNMRRHYVEDWGEHGAEHYEIRLHKVRKGDNDE